MQKSLNYSDTSILNEDKRKNIDENSNDGNAINKEEKYFMLTNE